MKTQEERKLILDKDIFRHVNHGWRVATRSDTKCLMIKNKKPNGCLLTFLLLLLIVPGIIYFYMYKGRCSLMIEVTPEGNIKYKTTGLTSYQQSELRWY